MVAGERGTRLRIAAWALGLLGGASSAALGWFVAMVAAFGGIRGAGGAGSVAAVLGLSWLVLGGLGVMGAFLVVGREPSAGAALQLLSGAGCIAVSAMLGTALGAIPGILVLGAGVLASLPDAPPGRGSPSSRRSASPRRLPPRPPGVMSRRAA